MAVDLVLLQRPADSRTVDWTSSLFHGSHGEALRPESDPVEDITIRVTRPGGAGLRHNGHHAKPSTKLEDGGLDNGLKTRRRLKARSDKPPYGKTCSVRQE